MMTALSRALVRLCGWTPEGEPPSVRKYVLIAAPHTSNWDFVWVLAFARVFGVRINWVGKHTLFRRPFGTVMRWLGGIPVRRDERQSLVHTLADRLKAADAMCLVVPVEGTRGHAPNWKSGFYHIARTAGVPIVMGYLDYGAGRAGFGPAFYPTGDVRRDMDAFRAFYAGKTGKYPANSGSIRLVEESDPTVVPAAVA